MKNIDLSMLPLDKDKISKLPEFSVGDTVRVTFKF